jgi:regulator of cell morphogenesis and NO signaling
MLMQELTIADSVADWAIEHAESIRVFEKHGVEYCCGGKSLAYVCQQQSVDPFLVLQEIKEAIGANAKAT